MLKRVGILHAKVLQCIVVVTPVHCCCHSSALLLLQLCAQVCCAQSSLAVVIRVNSSVTKRFCDRNCCQSASPCRTLRGEFLVNESVIILNSKNNFFWLSVIVAVICGSVQLTVQVLSVCPIASLCKQHMKAIKTLYSLFFFHVPPTFNLLRIQVEGHGRQTENIYNILYLRCNISE